MSRALEEYEVLGIRTTIPFFLWLMRQPDFRAARFDTTYLDSLLASRAGESFSTFDEHDERHIAIAAALDAVLRASRFAAEPARGERNAWTMTARREALRT
jgi:acetyl-CoA carboxylase biotin carboxylase subunit